MSLPEKYYAVLLHRRRIGTLCQRGDYTRFLFNEDYLHDPQRAVLGLRFEEALRKPYAASLRLPCWFSNLLPEGPLRQWIADDRGVSLDREMELLAQVGHDLPGAVQVLPADGPDSSWQWPSEESTSQPRASSAASESVWRFSFAGVAMKFSMLADGERLTVPAANDRGDWIVKFPDYRFDDVPSNEYAMMSLARDVGIDVPPTRLVHRDELEGLPPNVWPGHEMLAFAVKRFDRSEGNRSMPIHIEDLAQVRDIYPEAKYQGTFETVAALVYRGIDLDALREFGRRLSFIVLIGNGDAHLKNWSLTYPDGRIPTLSPAYDLVSTQSYRGLGRGEEDLGLKLGGRRRFESVRLSSFASLESRLDARFGTTGADLADVAAEVATRTVAAWPDHRGTLELNRDLLGRIDEWLKDRAASLLAH